MGWTIAFGIVFAIAFYRIGVTLILPHITRSVRNTADVRKDSARHLKETIKKDRDI